MTFSSISDDDKYKMKKSEVEIEILSVDFEHLRESSMLIS